MGFYRVWSAHEYFWSVPAAREGVLDTMLVTDPKELTV